MTDTERILKLKLIVAEGFNPNSLEVHLWHRFARAISHDEFDRLERYILHCLGKISHEEYDKEEKND